MNFTVILRSKTIKDITFLIKKVMGSTISTIVNYFCPRDLSVPFSIRVDKELNDWMVDQYANNRYLAKIPSKRIESEKIRIVTRLSRRSS